MKDLPNIITGVRLLAALCILVACFRADGERYFLPLFITGGVSDMLDGFIARRFNWCTEFGAKLDSVSDLMLYVAGAIFLTCKTNEYVRVSETFILLGLAVQIIHLALSYWKLKQFPAYHTTFCRICAYAIFFSVIAFWLHKSTYVLPAIAMLWVVCSLEGIAITMILNKPASDIAGIRAALFLGRQSSEVRAADAFKPWSLKSEKLDKIL